MATTASYLDVYREQGFAVVKGVLAARDIDELGSAFDAMQAEGSRHHASFRHGNLFYLVRRDPELGPILRLMQWASYVNPVCARYRNDPRLLQVIEPLVGRDLKQITNSLIWKSPRSSDSGFAFHQDSRFRRPAHAFRNLPTSIIQTAIAVDPHRPENGCMRMYPGSHRLGDLQLGVTNSVYEAAGDGAQLARVGLSPDHLVDVILDPGDMVIWHQYTVHGSHANTSRGDRRSYVNAYAVASDSDRGEWAFRDGEPCGLGEPVLVQYDALYVRPEPHYVDGPPHPFKPG
jgi:ectoine hydroxylase-related dioxygenase (phytanoyl-CoA dioxygenase family)